MSDVTQKNAPCHENQKPGKLDVIASSLVEVARTKVESSPGEARQAIDQAMEALAELRPRLANAQDMAGIITEFVGKAAVAFITIDSGGALGMPIGDYAVRIRANFNAAAAELANLADVIESELSSANGRQGEAG